MTTCPRGFLFMKNSADGSMRPFFLKVREEDIIATEPRDDGWVVKKKADSNMVEIEAHMDLPGLNIISGRKAIAEIIIPEHLTSNSIIMVTKYSNDNEILESCILEAQLTNYAGTTSNTLEITLISPTNDLMNLSNTPAKLNIIIHGYTE